MALLVENIMCISSPILHVQEHKYITPICKIPMKTHTTIRSCRLGLTLFIQQPSSKQQPERCQANFCVFIDVCEDRMLVCMIQRDNISLIQTEQPEIDA